MSDIARVEARLRWHHPSGELYEVDALTALGVFSATGYSFSEAVPAASISELLLVTR